MSETAQNNNECLKTSAPGERGGSGCACPKTCPRHGDCRACVKNHRETDSMPYCLFKNNDGNKSLENFYKKLKERFEPERSGAYT